MSEQTTVDNRIPVQIRSIRTTRWLWIDNTVYDHYATQLGLEGLGLYVALARYANNKTAQCWPSLPRLATEMGTEVALLEEALHRLEAAKLIHIGHHPTKGTILTLLKPSADTLPAPAPVPVAPTLPSRACEDELNSKQDLKNKPCSSLREEEQPERKEQPLRCAPAAGKKEYNHPDDETSSWTKPPVAWTAQRPDALLATAQLSPDDYATCYAAAKATLIAEGVKALCLITPIIEARMTSLLAPRVSMQSRSEGCLHEHVDTNETCNDCGEVLTPVA